MICCVTRRESGRKKRISLLFVVQLRQETNTPGNINVSSQRLLLNNVIFYEFIQFNFIF